MNFISSQNPDNGISAVANRIVSALNAKKKVLWLVPGGSNIPISVDIMNEIKLNVPTEDLSLLTITLTDERYGAVGHPDSNWQQLIDAGFDFAGINHISVLSGLPVEIAVSNWDEKMKIAFAQHELVIGQFGMGTDGHIAGIHPHSPAISMSDLACVYMATEFIRVTLTMRAIRQIHCAYLFVFGTTKKDQILRLKENISVEEQPAQILKQLPEAYVYSDQV